METKNQGKIQKNMKNKKTFAKNLNKFIATIGKKLSQIP